MTGINHVSTIVQGTLFRAIQCGTVRPTGRRNASAAWPGTPGESLVRPLVVLVRRLGSANMKRYQYNFKESTKGKGSTKVIGGQCMWVRGFMCVCLSTVSECCQEEKVIDGLKKGLSGYVSGFLRAFLTVLVRGYMNDPDAVARHIPPHLSRKKCGAQETPLGVHSITWQCTLSHTFQVK